MWPWPLFGDAFGSLKFGSGSGADAYGGLLTGDTGMGFDIVDSYHAPSATVTGSSANTQLSLLACHIAAFGSEGRASIPRRTELTRDVFVQPGQPVVLQHHPHRHRLRWRLRHLGLRRWHDPDRLGRVPGVVRRSPPVLRLDRRTVRLGLLSCVSKCLKDMSGWAAG
eukprot:2342454-Rhodomonas_salina.4